MTLRGVAAAWGRHGGGVAAALGRHGDGIRAGGCGGGRRGGGVEVEWGQSEDGVGVARGRHGRRHLRSYQCKDGEKHSLHMKARASMDARSESCQK